MHGLMRGGWKRGWVLRSAEPADEKPANEIAKLRRFLPVWQVLAHLARQPKHSRPNSGEAKHRQAKHRPAERNTMFPM